MSRSHTYDLYGLNLDKILLQKRNRVMSTQGVLSMISSNKITDLYNYPQQNTGKQEISKKNQKKNEVIGGNKNDKKLQNNQKNNVKTKVQAQKFNNTLISILKPQSQVKRSITRSRSRSKEKQNNIQNKKINTFENDSNLKNNKFIEESSDYFDVVDYNFKNEIKKKSDQQSTSQKNSQQKPEQPVKNSLKKDIIKTKSQNINSKIQNKPEIKQSQQKRTRWSKPAKQQKKQPQKRLPVQKQALIQQEKSIIQNPLNEIQQLKEGPKGRFIMLDYKQVKVQY